MRGPFEPANNLAAPVDESVSKPFYRDKLPPPPEEPPARQPVRHEPGTPTAPEPGNGKPLSQAARASMWSPSAKMDQIKDLYLTAEAIGEDALDRHFQLVSERQRQLIREYFNNSPDSGTAGEPR